MGNTPIMMKCRRCVLASDSDAQGVKYETGAPFTFTGRAKPFVRHRRRHPTFRGFKREFVCAKGHAFWSTHDDGALIAARGEGVTDG